MQISISATKWFVRLLFPLLTSFSPRLLAQKSNKQTKSKIWYQKKTETY